jgi:hypothetical protein
MSKAAVGSAWSGAKAARMRWMTKGPTHGRIDMVGTVIREGLFTGWAERR